MTDSIKEKDDRLSEPIENKTELKKGKTLAHVRGLFAILVFLAEWALVIYWINGLVRLEGEGINILVSFQYVLSVLELIESYVTNSPALYSCLSKFVIGIVYIVYTVLILKNVMQSFPYAKIAIGGINERKGVSSALQIEAFKRLQLSFYYTVLKAVSFILFVSFLVNCRLPQETVWVFVGAMVIKLAFPFFLDFPKGKDFLREVLNAIGTVILFFAVNYITFHFIKPWTRMIWMGSQAFSGGFLQYNVGISFLFSYFVEPALLLILFVKIHGFLKELFNSLELSGNKELYARAKSLLIFLIVLTLSSWWVSEIASWLASQEETRFVFAWPGLKKAVLYVYQATSKYILYVYQATSEYHLPILSAIACVMAYFFPLKRGKESVMM